ncbi:MAG: methyltransferase domain-containing protein [Methanothrix sp.]|nr:MAG: methyltransferase domain-containing protein [Methanothrix sp.]
MLSELMNNHKRVDVTKMRANNFLQKQNEIELNKVMAIQNGEGWEDVSRCPLCGCQERQAEFRKHGVDIVCCVNCGSRYGTQIAANLDDVYKNSGYLSYSKEDNEEHYNYRRERFGRERVAILEKYCGDITDKYLIDIGCGNGYFLSVAMEKCKHCYGTEFSDKLREFTEQKTGLTIYNKSLDDLPLKSFDIVTLFDVIEHIPDPDPFMQSVDKILNPGGYVLIFTPNFDSFSINVMHEYSSIVDPTEHVVLYTLPSLSFLAKKMGYDVVYSETQGLDILNILSMQQYIDDKQDHFLVEWNNELQAMINVSRCGDYARILFRKP